MLAVRLGNTAAWRDEVPVVRAKLRLAVHSIARQDPGALSDHEKLCRLLKMGRNKRVKKIIEQFSVEALAFAIYSALN